MKRLILAVVVLLLFALCACAQDAPLAKGLIGKGIKAGINLANVSGSDTDLGSDANKKMLLGFAGGAFITYGFTPMFAIQPELLYTMKGAKYKEEGGDGKLTWKYNYIEIPVLLKIMPQMQGNVKPNFFAGPFVGILMSGKWKLEEGGDAEELDVKDEMKSTEFGLAIGAGVDFAMGKGKLTFDGRYDLGLSKVFDEIEGYTPEIKTGTISFMVGYSF